MARPRKGPIGKIADYIGKNFISLHCEKCQHWHTFDPLELGLSWGEDTSLVELARRATCKRCGHRGAAVQILPGTIEYGGPPRLQ